MRSSYRLDFYRFLGTLRALSEQLKQSTFRKTWTVTGFNIILCVTAQITSCRVKRNKEVLVSSLMLAKYLSIYSVSFSHKVLHVSRRTLVFSVQGQTHRAEVNNVNNITHVHQRIILQVLYSNMLSWIRIVRIVSYCVNIVLKTLTSRWFIPSTAGSMQLKLKL